MRSVFGEIVPFLESLSTGKSVGNSARDFLTRISKNEKLSRFAMIETFEAGLILVLTKHPSESTNSSG